MSGNETICSTVFRLFSDAYGSWKTICISRRNRRSSREETPKRSVESKWTPPEVGSSSRSSRRASVDLPEAGLAHEPDRLAAVEHERDVVDRLDDAPRTRPAEAEVPTEVVDDDEELAVPGRLRARGGRVRGAHAAAPRTGKWHSATWCRTTTGGGSTAQISCA